MRPIRTITASRPSPTLWLLCRSICLLLLLTALCHTAPAVAAQRPEDSALFLAGFDSYQKKDFIGSANTLSSLLQKYPDSQLRDLAMFWLSRSYYRSGNQLEAARYLAQFVREYPDSPLKETVEDDMFGLVTRFERGELLPTGAGGAGHTGQQAG